MLSMFSVRCIILFEYRSTFTIVVLRARREEATVYCFWRELRMSAFFQVAMNCFYSQIGNLT